LAGLCQGRSPFDLIDIFFRVMRVRGFFGSSREAGDSFPQ
jgi:hypothetical protein